MINFKNCVKVSLLLMVASICVTSCTDSLLNDPIEQNTQNFNAHLSLSGSRTSDSDTSDVDLDYFDDCFEFIYPIEITFSDGRTESVLSEEVLEALIDSFFETNADSTDFPIPNFPLDIILFGMDTVTAISEMDLYEIVMDCDDKDDDSEYDDNDDDDSEDDDDDEDDEDEDDDDDDDDDEDDDDGE